MQLHCVHFNRDNCCAGTFVGGGRLRVDDDSTGLGPPLYENQTLADSGMRQGYRVILEPGVAPLDSQVTGVFV